MQQLDRLYTGVFGDVTNSINVSFQGMRKSLGTPFPSEILDLDRWMDPSKAKWTIIMGAR
jgi:hypothetical protein